MSEPITRVTETPKLPPRRRDAHKGDVGRILVIGGRMDEIGIVGGPALTANAAFRSGAGLVQVATCGAAMPSIAVLAHLATFRRLDYAAADLVPSLLQNTSFPPDVVAIGPGLDPAFDAGLMRELLSSAEAPLVIDADGLNLLATMPQWWAHRRGPTVLTPHPGEMRRLMAGLDGSADLADREGVAVRVASTTRAVVVLKGAATVVSDGRRVYVNATGNPGMATGGSGDVLTGIIAALIGQRLAPFDAAALGVHVHGLAGDLAADAVGILSMTADDIITHLKDAFGRLSEG